MVFTRSFYKQPSNEYIRAAHGPRVATRHVPELQAPVHCAHAGCHYITHILPVPVRLQQRGPTPVPICMHEAVSHVAHSLPRPRPTHHGRGSAAQPAPAPARRARRGLRHPLVSLAVAERSRRRSARRRRGCALKGAPAIGGRGEGRVSGGWTRRDEAPWGAKPRPVYTSCGACACMRRACACGAARAREASPC